MQHFLAPFLSSIYNMRVVLRPQFLYIAFFCLFLKYFWIAFELLKKVIMNYEWNSFEIEDWRGDNSHGAHWCPQMPTGCDRWNPLFVRGAHDSPDTHHKLHILLHSPIYNIKYKYIYVFLSGYRGYLFIFTLNYIKMRK